MAAVIRMPSDSEYMRRGGPAFGHVKVAAFKQTGIDETLHVIEGLSSTPQQDRDGEVIQPKAFAAHLDEYMANPIVTWCHSWWDIPIGLTLDAKITPEGLWTRKQIDVEDEFAARIWTAVKNRRVRSDSVGFNGDYTSDFGQVNKDGNWVWTDNLRLLEIALVPIPSNSGATFAIAKSLGLTIPKWVMEGKGAGGAAGLPLAPEDTAWDGAGARARMRDLCGGAEDMASMDWSMFGKAFFWHDPEAADQMGGYKLGFADVIDGKMAAVWAGVAACMGSLFGARAPLQIPEADRKPVYDRIAAQYARFDKTPPEFKGEWPERLKDVTFHCDELDLIEEQRAMEDLAVLDDKATSLDNITRHWQKESGGPSARVLSVATRTIVVLAGVVKAGEVLAAANLADLTTARDSIASVLTRHEAARARREPKDEGADAGAEGKDADPTETKGADAPITLEFLGPEFLAPPTPTDWFAGAEALLQGSEQVG